MCGRDKPFKNSLCTDCTSYTHKDPVDRMADQASDAKVILMDAKRKYDAAHPAVNHRTATSVRKRQAMQEFVALEQKIVDVRDTILDALWAGNEEAPTRPGNQGSDRRVSAR